MSAAGVVLAAGASRRFGAANKLLAPYRGKPMVCHALASLDAAPLAHRAIVLGCDDEAVRQAIVGFSGAVLFNQDWQMGLSSSLHCAVSWAHAADASRLVVALGDMPNISSDDIARLLAASEAAPDALVRATHNGQPGNPVVVPRSAFEQTLRTVGDQGARALIQAGFVTIDVALGAQVSQDVDTPEALEGLG